MRARFALPLAALLLAAAAAGVGSFGAGANGHCPPEQKIHYFRNLTSSVTGTLVADIRSESMLTYRHCDLVHVDTFRKDVTYRSAGGAYHLVVVGEHPGAGEFRDEYWLHQNDPAFRANVTRVYNASHVTTLRYTGVSGDGQEVSSNEFPLSTVGAIADPGRFPSSHRGASPWMPLFTGKGS